MNGSFKERGIQRGAKQKDWENLNPRRKRALTEPITAQLEELATARNTLPESIAANIMFRYYV